MAAGKRRKEAAAVARAPQPRVSWGLYAALAAAAFVVVCWAYSPAMHGPFLFDDNTIRMNWLWAAALGFVKLRVPSIETVEALEILALAQVD